MLVFITEEFKELIVQYGYVNDRSQYHAWLDRGAVVVSTAIQENFGIAVLDAIARGCHPLLPNRLSYPELIPEAFHSACLYESTGDLANRLCALLAASATAAGDPPRCGAPAALVEHARSFAWEARIDEFDRLLEEMVAESPADPPHAGGGETDGA